MILQPLGFPCLLHLQPRDRPAPWRAALVFGISSAALHLRISTSSWSFCRLLLLRTAKLYLAQNLESVLHRPVLSRYCSAWRAGSISELSRGDSRHIVATVGPPLASDRCEVLCLAIAGRLRHAAYSAAANPLADRSGEAMTVPSPSSHRGDFARGKLRGDPSRAPRHRLLLHGERS